MAELMVSASRFVGRNQDGAGARRRHDDGRVVPLPPVCRIIWQGLSPAALVQKLSAAN